MSGSRLNRQLGDKHLNPEESVIRLREELLKMASKAKIGGQAELEDSDRAAGPRLYYTEILRRVRNLNPELQVVRGMEGSVALYRPLRPWEIDPEQVDPDRPEWFNRHRYCGGMKKDWLPEYAYVLLDSSNLPTREVRGWRSVLIGLIRAGVITESGAAKEFGDPYHDQRSGRWFAQMYEIRNTKRGNANV